MLNCACTCIAVLSYFDRIHNLCGVETLYRSFTVGAEFTGATFILPLLFHFTILIMADNYVISTSVCMCPELSTHPSFTGLCVRVGGWDVL